MSFLIGDKEPRCILCNEPSTDDDPLLEVRGWIRAMLGQDGMAHHQCMARTANDAAFSKGDVPWDISRPHPALVNLVETKRIVPGRVFEPGPGLGHDAVYLASNGFRVTALDISTRAVSMLRKRITKLGLDIDLIVGDVLRDGPTEGEFDYIFERSVLQTLPPTQRAHYILRLAKNLKPKGEYLGIIRGPREPIPESQPYAFTRDMIEKLLSTHFGNIEITRIPSGSNNSQSEYFLVIACRR
ncbi:MAG: methyltransferase domain-containing protein [Candidatus Thorarchaeota archaeon]|jgi:SAM-dependent methyltransferase|nr:methyltransferase domain-containing protein [Candidatus Thorarchaeota archaeon]